MAMAMSNASGLQRGIARSTPLQPFRVTLSARRSPQRVQAVQNSQDTQGHVIKAAAWSAMAATFLTSGSACAATEIMSQAAGDSRANVLLVLPAIAVGWVLYNIGGPALSQLGDMSDKGSGKKRAASVVGLMAASMFAAGNADAAQEMGQLAAGDSRVLVIATLFVPIIGWVLFNIGGPALNQFQETAAKNSSSTKRRSVIGVTALSAASLMAAQSADAANEVSQLAAGDSRILVIATLFVPIIGWVLFNIGGPAFSQFKDIAAKREASNPKGKGRR